ncbi:hypothetical protein [Herminiimonas sp. CN]|uniref:hypothetical protein n=1 Tax=Herminiimonas sp. CN TaxID=1349818 RepID=UPI001EE65F3D|nr:hypothetical protein [Herminiimonas sp. CN]
MRKNVGRSLLRCGATFGTFASMRCATRHERFRNSRIIPGYMAQIANIPMHSMPYKKYTLQYIFTAMPLLESMARSKPGDQQNIKAIIAASSATMTSKVTDQKRKMPCRRTSRHLSMCDRR